MKRFIIAVIAVIAVVMGIEAGQPAYRGYIDTGYSFGAGDRSTPQWLLQTVHGVDFIPEHLFVGGGVGVGIAVESGEEAYSLPIFADARYTIGSRKVRPFVDMRAGYSLIWNSKHPGGNEGGFYFAPSVGVTVPVASGIAINAGLGYTVARAHYKKEDSPSNSQKFDYNAGGVNLMVGVTF